MPVPDFPCLPPHLQRIEDDANRIGQRIIALLNQEKASPVAGMAGMLAAILNGLRSAPQPLPEKLEALRIAAEASFVILGDMVDEYESRRRQDPSVN